jgi:hypothetical protein
MTDRALLTNHDPEGAYRRADARWQAALDKRYGAEGRAARYDARGVATPTLAELHYLAELMRAGWNNDIRRRREEANA